MLDFYLGCMIVGIALALISFIFGDILDGVIDGSFEFLHYDFIKPIILISALTAFGGVGYLAEKYLSLPTWIVIIISIIAAVVIAVIVLYSYVKPMKKAENSTGYSIQELVGKMATVIVPIPKDGYGEILIKVGAGNISKPAKSFDKEDIPFDSKVVVVEIKSEVLYVSKI